MERRSEAWLRFLRSQQRGIASLAVTVLMANGLIVASRAMGPNDAAPDSFIGAPIDDPATTFDESTPLPKGSTVRDNGTILGADGTVYVIDDTGNLVVKRPGKHPIIRPTVDPIETVQGVTDDTIEIVYYWKGERPRYPDAPQLEGTGEIRVETVDRATGYWTTRSDRDPGLNARTSGVYARADPSDLQVLDGGSEEDRAKLIAQRLREWKSAM